MMNRKQEQYAAYCGYQAEYARLIAGERPVMVVEKFKSPQAWRTIHRHFDGLIGSGKWSDYCMINVKLDAEDGATRDNAIVLGLKPSVLSFLRLLRIRNELSRSEFQTRMGLLFEYDLQDVVDFVASDLGKSCPCEMCGGAPNKAAIVEKNGPLQQSIRRTMVHS